MKIRTMGTIWALAGMLIPSLAAGAADGDFAWVKAMGGPNIDEVRDMVLDKNGNIYITGCFWGVSDFDPGPGVFELSTVYRQDIFVLKLDSAGNLVWAVSIGGTADEESYGIALDTAGNVYTTGIFFEMMDFDPGPGIFDLTAQGNACAFILKMDTSGNFVWAGAFTATSSTSRDIAVNGEGDIHVTGRFIDHADFDPGPDIFEMTTTPEGEPDIYVSKLDTDRNFVWAKALDGSGFFNCPYGITLDDADHVYTTGMFEETVDFDPGPGMFTLSAPDTLKTYVSKLDRDGNFVWAAEFGQGIGHAVTVDGAGNLYTLGRFKGTADFDPGPGTFELTAKDPNFAAFVSKLDQEANFVWAIQLGEGDGGSVGPGGFTVDGAGNVYVTGPFHGTVDFDPGPETAELTSSGWESDTFILKLDALGSLVWLKHLNGMYEGCGSCIAVDPFGSTYTCGAFVEEDFDPGPGTFELASVGWEDIFIMKLSGPPPEVIDITLVQSNPTEGGILAFTVKFSTEVTGVDASDFTLTTTGTLANAQIIHVTGTGNEYMVTVAGTEGDGTLRLDLIDNDSITDGAGTPLGGIGTGNADYADGDIYTIVPELSLGILSVMYALLLMLGICGVSRTHNKRCSKG